MSKPTEDVDEIAKLLQQTEVRQENVVSFKGQGLKLDKAEDADKIVKAINDCTDVQVLELVGNTLGVEAATEIAKALKNKSELQKCLWADLFTGRLRSEIPPTLRCLGAAIMEANAHLVEIDLSHNAFGPDGIKSCVDLLLSPCCYTLQVLKFNNNGLGIGGKILAQTLIKCYNSSKAEGKPLALKVFIAGRNRLENPCAIALAEAFKTIGSLEEIHMPQNGINHEGITALANAVMNSPNLRHLNLNDNTFTEPGAIAMAKAIEKLNSLEIINFGDCLVKTEGAAAIGRALKNSNPDLKELNLSFGEVRLEGALVVCESVGNKEHIASINLNGNQLGEDGVSEIEAIADEAGYIDILEEFDDDEGVDTEDEDDSENSEEGEEEEEVEIKSEIKSPSYIPTANGISNNKLDGGGVSTLIITTLENDIQNFANIINASNLRAMTTEQRKSILQHATNVDKDPEEYVDNAIKIAGLLSSRIPLPSGSKNPLEVPVNDCIDAYMKAAFSKVQNCPMRVMDRILIRMGLLKSEDKKIKSFPNVEPTGLVLSNVIKSSYFPHSTKKTVRAMVAKDNSMWDKHINLRNRLLESLY